MFADMVGYTALMQEDEEKAHAQRERHREVLTEVVPRFNGEILQHYGDGTLSVFTSAVQAVEAAVEIQQELRRGRDVPLRIGVHAGDIVHDADGVYGDSVNVAARIEALSAPGGVLISGMVFDEIKNHPSLSAVHCGVIRLKNVKRPQRVFAVVNEGLSVPPAFEVEAEPEPSEYDSVGAPGAGELFLRRLKDRALVQWTLVYLASAWLVVEVVKFLSREMAWPPVVQQGVALVAFAGIFFTVVVAWYHGERGRQRFKRIEIAIYAVMSLVTAGALTTLPTGTPASAGPNRGAIASRTADARPAVAVLPFMNLSGDDDQAFFALGLHDAVLTQLQKISGLRVISRTSVMEYGRPDGRPSVRVIADNLGVGYVTEATVQGNGERLLVNIRLVDARTNVLVWAESYDREVSDAFEVQSSIARMIANAMAISLTEAEEGAIARPPTTDSEAYQLYLQGREYMLRPGYHEENFLAAEALFERAATLDPEFALVRAELSQVHGTLYWENFDRSPEQLELQRSLAEEALRLNPGLPEAHNAMGSAYYVAADYVSALEEYRIALEGLPSDAQTVARIGYTHRRLGQWPQVFEAFELATSLNPRNANLQYDLGGHSFLANRRYREAAEAYGRAELLAPDLYDAAIHKGHTYVHWQGQLDTLGAVVARLPALHLPEIDLARVEYALWSRDPDALLSYLRELPGPAIETQLVYYPRQLLAGWAFRLRGDEPSMRLAFDSARAALEALDAQSPDDERVVNSLGYAYAGLGRSQDAADRAVRAMRSRQRAGLEISEVPGRILAQAGLAELAVPYLEAVLEAHSPYSVHTMTVDPLLDPIREHPAFRALLERHSGGG
jgi:TolB-like protein/Flp pilus assembly protein TadD